jgi:hypothetical protein
MEGGVQLGAPDTLDTSATDWLIVPSPDECDHCDHYEDYDDYDDGEFGGHRLSDGSRSDRCNVHNFFFAYLANDLLLRLHNFNCGEIHIFFHITRDSFRPGYWYDTNVNMHNSA